MEQITVTATAGEHHLIDVESNLSVVDTEALDLIQHEHINQALSRVSGGWISRGNGQEHLTAIRSPVLTGAGGCGAFFIAQDGVSLRAPGFCNTNQLFDANTEQASRIEVLKGPNSTLYGSNAVHGVINVITPDAFNQKFSTVGFSTGPNDYYKGNYSTQFSNEEHAFLLYGNGSHDGGYKDNSGYAQQKINFIHQFQSPLWSTKTVIAATNLNQETAGFIQGFESYKDEGLKTDNPNPEAFRDSQAFRAYSEIKYQVNPTTLYQMTPYVRWTEMEFLQHYLPWQPVEKNAQKSLGVKASIEKQFEHFNWFAGIDADLTEGELEEFQGEAFSTTIPAGMHYDYTVDASVISPSTQLQWLASEALTLSAGVRYDKTEYDYNNHLSAGDACAPTVDNCRFTRPIDQKVDFDEFSYQLSGRLLLADSMSIYGQVSNGYRSPQATELFRLQAGQQVTDLQSEKMTSIELGTRGLLNSLFYDVTLYTMEKENFIFQDTNRHNISNGKTSHFGIEFTLNYMLPNDFYVNANGTFANHQYESSLLISREDINGNEIDTAPQHMGSVQVGWQPQARTRVELEWLHLGNYYLNPENTAEYTGHNLFNLRAAFTLNRHWSVNVRVLNLLDEDYAERADFGFGNYRYFVGEPRSVFASINYMFDE
ncbi:TonB-dependent receptor [Thalassotalea sp. M1531]|uniref:TonB-dependent receptor n=2 Tax=Thalassotalea algicola TaxID=2716224 RepID=A0A7Y0L9F4_9GAMM|nr:TonB-dependent receptor [Thalassotalea algicola]